MKKFLVLALSLLFCVNCYASGIDANTPLMLHFNGTDASTTITDSSLAPLTCGVEGNAKLNTTTKKFGTASLRLDGNALVNITDSAAFNFGTSPFAIDCQVNFIGNDTNGTSFTQAVNNTQYYELAYFTKYLAWISYNDTGKLTSRYYTTWNPANGTWYHIEVDRNGANVYLYIDGVNQTCTADPPITTNATGDFAVNGTVGAFMTAAQRTAYAPGNLSAYIDELRVSNISRHGDGVSFTPPSVEYSPDAASAQKTFSRGFIVY